MAEKIVSPGVFTQERDLSFLPQGIANIGAAILPAAVPAIIPSAARAICGAATIKAIPNSTATSPSFLAPSKTGIIFISCFQIQIYSFIFF